MIYSEKNNSYKSNIIIYEIEFKGGRKDYYVSPNNLTIKPPDHVIVQADRGEHIGCVNRSCPWSMLPHVKEIKSIIRHASYTDMQIMMDNKLKEEEAFTVCEKKIEDHELKMKLVDVEIQFDGNKICFYFTADKRIDFRALVKDLAAEYRTRIELRQIGVRDEARRYGGIGVCGRLLCCKTFLNQFEPITSQMARDQNLSLSPSKISGLCGRLMCCLAFEEDFYKLQSDVFPSEGVVLEKDGEMYDVVKVDFFTESFIIRDNEGEEQTLSIDDFADYRIVKSQADTESATCHPGCDNCAEGCDDKPEQEKTDE